jgi:hypothetical protein
MIPILQINKGKFYRKEYLENKNDDTDFTEGLQSRRMSSGRSNQAFVADITRHGSFVEQGNRPSPSVA